MLIGTDIYGREMDLQHIGNRVFCSHMKDRKVVKVNYIDVSDEIIRMFSISRCSGAYIYDTIQRMYGKRL